MKVARQAKILELIENEEIETQDELAKQLKESGFHVTQATVSRDIKDMRLIKIMSKSGRHRYAPFRDAGGNQLSERIVNVFRESVVSIDYSGNLVVIKTFSGGAMAASVAIDSMEWSDVVGCLAGDDTIFVAIRNQDKVVDVVEKFKKLMK
ncbi:arginine repressor [Alkalibacter saccharofermentans]|uniref:Arginine repressor n=1 Tax=Alkalibacter saccharofermentans DSM 14828 TaxID=1120975 RepID=A0A1M4UGC0_9FIRM|nr:arginine repressor [Alkalibacter saccharofermentans]SHE55678.1 transcriptional regulator, ArgR family [Alkalibacter saccharofermentans DSM 14828]